MGTDCLATPSCRSGGTGAVACLARRTTRSLGRNRFGAGIEEAGLVNPCAGADDTSGAIDWPDAGAEMSPELACVISIRIADSMRAENLLESKILLMTRSLLAPEELSEGAESLQLILS